MTGLILRDLSGIAEFLQAEALQRTVWGEGDLPDPGDLMMVIQAEGGLCAGAFRDEMMLGYVFGFPTRDPGVQHSHRLAVLPQMRGQGLGLRLKWYQRDWCLARGINLVRWTFDPLRLANASLNIASLGAKAHVYCADYYGAMNGINAGVPSDRLLVDWQMNDHGVVLRAQGQPVGMPPDRITRRIAICPDFEETLQQAPDRALADRLRVRHALQDAFANHEEIADFDRPSGEYILAKRAHR